MIRFVGLVFIVICLINFQIVYAEESNTSDADIVVRVDRDIRVIPRTLYGTNVEWADFGNGIWHVPQEQYDPDITHLASELDLSLIRFPGGTFSDFYHWKDGIGLRQERGKSQPLPGQGDFQSHDFGTDEALEFAKQVGGTLLITVNAGTGTPEEAASWITYVNKKKAAKDEAFKVTCWEVGNELYVKGTASIAPDVYAERFLSFAQAMRQADPSIKIMAIGEEQYYENRDFTYRYPKWNETVLKCAGAEMDFLAVHNAYAPVLYVGSDNDVRTVYTALMASPLLIKRMLDKVSNQIETFVPNRADDIKIAVTEWGPLFSYFPSNRYVDHPKTLGSALFTASVLKVFIESPKVEIANQFKLSDFLFIGLIGLKKDVPFQDWIDMKKSIFAPTASYFAFQMYTKHFGEVLLESHCISPVFDSPAVGWADAVKDVPYLDVVASRSTDFRKVYILVINKHFDKPIEATVTLKGFTPATEVDVTTLNGTGIDANTGTAPLQVPGAEWGKQAEDGANPRFSKGGHDEVKITLSQFTVDGARFTYSFPAHSVTSIELHSQ